MLKEFVHGNLLRIGSVSQFPIGQPFEKSKGIAGVCGFHRGAFEVGLIAGTVGPNCSSKNSAQSGGYLRLFIPFFEHVVESIQAGFLVGSKAFLPHFMQ